MELYSNKNRNNNVWQETSEKLDLTALHFCEMFGLKKE